MKLESLRTTHTATRDLPANRRKRQTPRKPNRYMRRMMFRVKVQMRCPHCGLAFIVTTSERCQCKAIPRSLGGA